MKNEIYFGVMWRIVAMFIAMMFSTYIPEQLRPFLGDIPQEYKNHDMVDGCWDWGAGHYWYAWMTFLLFLLTLTNVIIITINLIFKHYPNLK